MARYDKDTQPHITPPNNDKHMDKPKGEMSIREAAAMEMPEQHLETGMPGTVVHGFGAGQAETVKRHTGIGQPWMPAQDMGPGMDMDMGTGMQQQSTGESVTEIVERIFQLPFQAQLGVMRMIAPRILGAMDARDQEGFLNNLRMELDSGVTSEENTEDHSMNMQDLQGT
jgi:hypothetical protein